MDILQEGVLLEHCCHGSALNLHHETVWLRGTTILSASTSKIYIPLCPHFPGFLYIFMVLVYVHTLTYFHMEQLPPCPLVPRVYVNWSTVLWIMHCLCSTMWCYKNYINIWFHWHHVLQSILCENVAHFFPLQCHWIYTQTWAQVHVHEYKYEYSVQEWWMSTIKIISILLKAEYKYVLTSMITFKNLTAKITFC